MLTVELTVSLVVYAKVWSSLNGDRKTAHTVNQIHLYVYNTTVKEWRSSVLFAPSL